MLLKKKKNEMCAITFLKACTLSRISNARVTFYIQNCFYSDMLRKNKNFPSAKLKKIISRNFQVTLKKKYLSIIFEVKRKKKKCFVEKQILTVNLP